MRKISILLALMMVLMCAGRSYAQFEDFENGSGDNSGRGGGNGQGRIIDRLRFGGNFGIGFDTDCFAVNFNPSVGYAFNQYVTAGVMVSLEYYKRESYYWGNYSQSIFGGGIYADAYPLQFLVVHGEAQAISYKDYYATSYDTPRRTDLALLIGGGYHRAITERAGINVMILWNLNATEGLANNTSYFNPIFRINFIF